MMEKLRSQIYINDQSSLNQQTHHLYHFLPQIIYWMDISTFCLCFVRKHDIYFLWISKIMFSETMEVLVWRLPRFLNHGRTTKSYVSSHFWTTDQGKLVYYNSKVNLDISGDPDHFIQISYSVDQLTQLIMFHKMSFDSD